MTTDGMFDVSSSFDASIYPIDDNHAEGIGDEVGPEETLPQHHVADKGVAERHEPRESEQLRELDEKGMHQSDGGDYLQRSIDQQNAPKAEHHHGPKRIASLVGQGFDTSRQQSQGNKHGDAEEGGKYLSAHNPICFRLRALSCRACLAVSPDAGP